MGLNPPGAGLRYFVNDSRDITRIELRVPPGAAVAVDDTVARQLPAAFKDPDVVDARDAERARRPKAKNAKAAEPDPADDPAES